MKIEVTCKGSAHNTTIKNAETGEEIRDAVALDFEVDARRNHNLFTFTLTYQISPETPLKLTGDADRVYHCGERVLVIRHDGTTEVR